MRRAGLVTALGFVIVGCGLSVVGTAPIGDAADGGPAPTTSATTPPQVDPDPIPDANTDAPLIDAGPDVVVTPPPTSPADCAPATTCDVVSASNVVDVAANADTVFWLVSDGTIQSAALDGSNAKTIVTGQTKVAGLEANATDIFWVSSTEFRRALVDGTNPHAVIPVADAFFEPGCLRFLDPTHLLIASTPDDTVESVDINTGKAMDRADVTSPFGALPAGPDTICTRSSEDDVRNYKNNVGTTIVSNQHDPRCMALDGTTMYWANHGSGDIQRAPTSGGTSVAFVTGQPGVSGLATTGPFLYWTHDGGVRRRRR